MAAAATCLRKTWRLTPSAAWVHLPAALRRSSRPAPSPAPPPTRPPPPLLHPLPPPLPPPRLLCLGRAAWISPALCRCQTSGSSPRCSGLAANVAERHRQSVTWREVSDSTLCKVLCWIASYNNYSVTFIFCTTSN